jgi:hypothetical protein
MYAGLLFLLVLLFVLLCKVPVVRMLLVVAVFALRMMAELVVFVLGMVAVEGVLLLQHWMGEIIYLLKASDTSV